MAVMVVQEFEVDEGDRSTTNYDGVSERLGADTDPPQGMIVHTAGFNGNSFRVSDVWESEADWERFRDGRLAEALKPMMESGEGTPPNAVYVYELHDVIKP
jgi:hypothetical protein